MERSLVFGAIFACVERALVFCVVFSACGKRSGILCYIVWPVERALVFGDFLHVELTLVFCDLYFLICYALLYFVLYLSLYGTCSGILRYIYIPDFIFILCFNILTLLFFISPLFCLFETIFQLRTLLLCNLVLYFSDCEMRSGIMEFCVIYFPCVELP